MDPFLELLKKLSDTGTRFVIVGGMAGIIHGARYVTQDLDIVAPFDFENLTHITDAIRPLNPRYRLHPNTPPMPMDPQELVGWKNMYLFTTLGQIDILGELPHVGPYDVARQHASRIDLGGFTCEVLDVDTLIFCKTKAARPKDRLAVLEFEKLLRHHDRSGDNPETSV